MNPKIKQLAGEGQYFSQVFFDGIMVNLATDLLEQMPDITEIELSYDPNQDYYHAKFTLNGHSVDIRSYKVHSAFIDGKEHWVGCHLHFSHRLARSIRRQIADTSQGTVPINQSGE